MDRCTGLELATFLICFGARMFVSMGVRGLLDWNMACMGSGGGWAGGFGMGDCVVMLRGQVLFIR